MRCSLRIKRSAAKALAALPRADRLRVVAAIDLLCDTPAAGSALKGEFEGLRRLRVGPGLIQSLNPGRVPAGAAPLPAAP
jgi:mRNA interferase RelE/StbE